MEDNPYIPQDYVEAYKRNFWFNEGPHEHGPLQKCLFYEGKWRNVCLACGKVEMEDGWRKL